MRKESVKIMKIDKGHTFPFLRCHIFFKKCKKTKDFLFLLLCFPTFFYENRTLHVVIFSLKISLSYSLTLYLLSFFNIWNGERWSYWRTSSMLQIHLLHSNGHFDNSLSTDSTDFKMPTIIFLVHETPYKMLWKYYKGYKKVQICSIFKQKYTFYYYKWSCIQFFFSRSWIINL